MYYQHPRYWTLSLNSKWSRLKTIINAKTRYNNEVVLKHAKAHTNILPKDLIDA